MASTTETFLTGLEARSLRSGCQHGWVLVRLSFWHANGCLPSLLSHGGERDISLPLLIKPHSCQTRAPPSFNLNCLLKILSPVIVTLGVRASTHKYWEDTIQFIEPEKVCLTRKNGHRAGVPGIKWKAPELASCLSSIASPLPGFFFYFYFLFFLLLLFPFSLH